MASGSGLCVRRKTLSGDPPSFLKTDISGGKKGKRKKKSKIFLKKKGKQERHGEREERERGRVTDRQTDTETQRQSYTVILQVLANWQAINWVSRWLKLYGNRCLG